MGERVVVRSVTPQLSERRGYCSLRQSNRIDGHPHPHPPLLESDMGQVKTQKYTQGGRQTGQDRGKRKRRTESEKQHETQKKQRKQKANTVGGH